MEQRLQKILAEMGIASRRKAEELIIEGRVTVNGQIASIGMKADPNRDHIKLDRKLLTRPEKKVYLVFNKPRGVVTSLYDPEGRPTIKDFLKEIKSRVFPVGRLDYNSEGMLLITNDGDFAHAVLHPSKKILKTYLVKVKGILREEEIEKLRTGVKLGYVMTAPAKVSPVRKKFSNGVRKIRKTEHNSWLEMTIYEGKKRQIRRILENVGHPVLKLKRIRIDGLEIGELEPGTYRYLSAEELSKIKHEALDKNLKLKIQNKGIP
ncbi:MAG: rRNA pseudouridine synthase [Nitrospirae bacterium]|nr:rRNA pseudouridine synthase [Nitrospirota bacterium]